MPEIGAHGGRGGRGRNLSGLEDAKFHEGGGMSGLSEREKNQHLLDDQRKSKLQENRFSRATDLSKSAKQRSRPGRNLHLSQGRLIPKFTHLR